MDIAENSSDLEFINQCYLFFMGRTPDPEGLANYVEQLKSGLTRADAIHIFSTSDEFKNRFQQFSNHLDSQTRNSFQTFAPDGHYFSPIPETEDFDEIHYPQRALPLLGEDFIDSEAMIDLATTLKPLYREFDYTAGDEDSSKRFKLNNGSFNHFDAIMLYLMIRHFEPKRIIEIGSGNSSALMLDTNERYFENTIETTFIEPYPKCLLSNLLPGDADRVQIHENKIQDISLELFDRLEADDILFVDSSHVSKFGSDLNHILFKILPKLKAGTIIHFHDVFHNFDYPKEWLNEGRAWNEGYLLRAFLSNNSDYEIIFFNDWFARNHWEFLEANLPLCTIRPKDSPFKNSGVSLWLRKIR